MSLNASLNTICRPVPGSECDQILSPTPTFVQELLQGLLALRSTSLPGQTQLLPILPVTLGEPLTGFHELDDIHPLFEEHDRSAGDCENPWHCAVHLVRSCQFHSSCAEWAWEEEGWLGGDWVCW